MRQLCITRLNPGINIQRPAWFPYPTNIGVPGDRARPHAVTTSQRPLSWDYRTPVRLVEGNQVNLRAGNCRVSPRRPSRSDPLRPLASVGAHNAVASSRRPGCLDTSASSLALRTKRSSCTNRRSISGRCPARKTCVRCFPAPPHALNPRLAQRPHAGRNRPCARLARHRTGRRRDAFTSAIIPQIIAVHRRCRRPRSRFDAVRQAIRPRLAEANGGAPFAARNREPRRNQARERVAPVKVLASFGQKTLPPGYLPRWRLVTGRWVWAC